VSRIGDALPTYQTLTGSNDARFLEFPDFRIAIVGPFMLMEGPAEVLANYRRSATVIVNDVAAATDAFVNKGGEVVDGPVDSGGGSRVIVKDRDGNAFELYQPAPGPH